jgi:hypothetical protein
MAPPGKRANSGVKLLGSRDLMALKRQPTAWFTLWLRTAPCYGFPERRKPESIFSDIDLQRRFFSYDRLNDEIGDYKLSLFAPSRYLIKEAKSLYKTHAGDPFSQADREKFLVGMMKVNFLKRLESSVHSFEITMERTIAKIEALERKIRNYQAMPDQNPESESLELDLQTPEGDEEMEAALLVGGKYKYELKHLELAKWLKDLQRDKEQLSMLHASAKDVTPARDAKLKELKRLIERKVKDPTTNKLGQPIVPDFLFFGPERDVDLSDYYGDTRFKKVTVRGLISGQPAPISPDSDPQKPP